MANSTLIRCLKITMVSGFALILLGVYFHLYSETIEKMGVTGMVISACCVAIGMIMSLPTKMYLTFVLVAHEQQQQDEKNRIAGANDTKCMQKVVAEHSCRPKNTA